MLKYIYHSFLLSPLGNVIYDFFMGRELNPRFFNGRLDQKFFFDMRVGLVSWALVDLGFLIRAYQVSGNKIDPALVAIVAFQLLYILDALWFEVRSLGNEIYLFYPEAKY